jgi:haloalkane dehalogenase
MKTLRTPDERFADLPGFDFEPHYAEVSDGEGGRLRVHYLDEGPADGETILLLHGEPSWSYLYRKMIPVLTGAGLRAIAPDLVGFGRSDKPADRGDYTYQRHVDWMRELVEVLDLRGVTLFGQDWGGLIGLRLAAENPERFARMVAANTFLPTGDHHPGEAFIAWRDYSQRVPAFDAGWIVNSGCASDLPDEIKAAYDAPFPDESYKEGARQFPALVPATPDDPAAAANRKAWEVLARWTKPFVTLFGDSDPITAGSDRHLQKLIPGTQGQPHATIEHAGHFLQEDRGEEVARHVVEFIARSPRAVGGPGVDVPPLR